MTQVKQPDPTKPSPPAAPTASTPASVAAPAAPEAPHAPEPTGAPPARDANAPRGARAFQTSIGLPPAAAPAQRSSYEASFGKQSYVHDGGDPRLLENMQKAAKADPALASGGFAQALASGKMGREDIKALQHALAAKGYSVGKAGVDGKYGPDTHRALEAMLSGAKPDFPPGTQDPAAHGTADHPDGKHGAKGQHGDHGDATGSKGDAPSADASHGDPPAGPQDPNLANRLRANFHNRFDNVKHQCFHYAWATVQGAGGKGMDHAPSTTEGRGQPIAHLDQMAAQGKLKVGDVVYVNRHPGTDDGSHRLSNGPHWFVYMGNGKYADQYNNSRRPRELSASQMQSFVKGRVIDRIFHPF